jgi:hypothetical protein
MAEQFTTDPADGEQAMPLSGVELIALERARQVTSEGWTPEHDDRHEQREMAKAASCYAYEAARTDVQRAADAPNVPLLWPWENAWWKPTDRVRDLVKAGALCAAEIDRLLRAGEQIDG